MHAPHFYGLVAASGHSGALAQGILDAHPLADIAPFFNRIRPLISEVEGARIEQDLQVMDYLHNRYLGKTQVPIFPFGGIVGVEDREALVLLRNSSTFQTIDSVVYTHDDGGVDSHIRMGTLQGRSSHGKMILTCEQVTGGTVQEGVFRPLSAEEYMDAKGDLIYHTQEAILQLGFAAYHSERAIALAKASPPGPKDIYPQSPLNN